MTSHISDYLSNHDGLYYSLLLINIALIIFAPWVIRPILSFIQSRSESRADPQDTFWINVVRGLNVLIIVLLGNFRFYYSQEGDGGESLPFKIISGLLVIYLSYLAANLVNRVLLRRYGKKVQSGDHERIADTYASRILSLFSTVLISIIAIISIVRIAGFSDLLETGGAIGIIGVMLALTQGSWAPDVISGLIILNTKLLAERDVIRIREGGDELYAVVHRTRAFHTELLSMVDNHRLMIRNSKLRDQTVHNLSRYASAKGVRESLRFKLGHDLKPEKVRQMFNMAFERAQAEDLSIEFQHPLEVRLQDAGDHAVEWSIHYYTKDEFSIIGTRQAFREQVLISASENKIDLSTPFTVLHNS